MFKLILSIIFTGVVSLANAQTLLIKGIVKDIETNLPLVGANVRVDSTLACSTSNSNGEFEIKVSQHSSMQISVTYTGYITENIGISSSKVNIPLIIKLTPKQTSIDEIVVTGTGTPHFTKNAPVQTDVFTQKSIEGASSGTIESLLSRLSPSFSMSTNAMGTFIKLNGLGNDYFIVMINGKRVYGDVGSQNDLSRIDPSTVERIELVKGASSSLYGSDAIAGVVNIITKKSDSPLAISSNTRVGGYGEVTHSTSIGFNKNGIGGLTTLGYSRSDGWKNTVFEVDKNGTPDNPNDDKLVKTATMTKNPMQSGSLKQRLSSKMSEQLSFNMDADITYREVTPPVAAKGYDFLYHNQSYDAGLNYLFKTNGNLTADLSYDRFRYLYRYEMKYNVTYKEADGTTKFVTYYPNDIALNNDQHRAAFNLKYNYKPNTRNNIVLGMEDVVEWMRSPYRLKADRVDDNEHSVYAQDELQVSTSLILTAGARLVYHNQFGEKITPKFSLLYKVGQFNIRATAAKGYKTPTLKELYYRYERDDMGAFRVYLGNPNLKPQTSTYFSTALEFSGGSFTLNMTPYVNYVDDMIEYQAVETSSEDKARGVEETKQYGNISNARILGVDINASYKPIKCIYLGFGYSYTDAQNTTSHCRLKDVALHHANARIEWSKIGKKQTLTAGFSSEYSSKLYGDALSESYYDRLSAAGYTLCKLNVVGKFQISRCYKIDLGAGIDNIFNYYETKPYGYSYGTSSPGRTFFLSLAVKYTKN